MIITSGRPMKFVREKRRTELKRGRKMKSSLEQKRYKSLILKLAQEKSKFYFVQNETN